MNLKLKDLVHLQINFFSRQIFLLEKGILAGKIILQKRLFENLNQPRKYHQECVR
jgi:hypothetical protein